MARYGRFSASGDTDMGTVAADNQRANVFGAMPENGWAHTIGFWGGKPSGGSSPTVRLAIWDTDSSGNPDDRMAYGSVTVNASQSFGGDGQAYTVSVANISAAYDFAIGAVPVEAGEKYSLGFVSDNFAVNHAMTEAANLSTSLNRNFYSRSGVSTPADPDGYTSTSLEGHMT